LVSADRMVKLKTRPFATSGEVVISGAGGCVGPIMKLPYALGLGNFPSGNSVAFT
jgi:hypothetical protein